jgi:uncharacterized lipoprotein YajG
MCAKTREKTAVKFYLAFVPLLTLSSLTGCIAPSTSIPSTNPSTTPSTTPTPKQLIAELQSRGYVCASRIPLGSKRSRIICKSPNQIAGENKEIGANNNQIERDLADIQRDR